MDLSKLNDGQSILLFIMVSVNKSCLEFNEKKFTFRKKIIWASSITQLQKSQILATEQKYKCNFALHKNLWTAVSAQKYYVGNFIKIVK